jgi:hypothetical protein
MSLLTTSPSHSSPLSVLSDPPSVSATKTSALRAASAMALLSAHADTDTIQLLGRWRSDEMLKYLTVQAQPIMRDFSSGMLQGGRYTLLPNVTVPIVPLPTQPSPPSSHSYTSSKTIKKTKKYTIHNPSYGFPTHPAVPWLHPSPKTYWRHTATLQAVQWR